jgi:hypothetical protein
MADNFEKYSGIGVFVLLVLVIFVVPYLAISSDSKRNREEKEKNIGAKNTAALEYGYSAYKRASDNMWVVIGRKGKLFGGYQDGYVIMSKPITEALTTDTATGFESKDFALAFYNLDYTEEPANKVYMEMKTAAFPATLSK